MGLGFAYYLRSGEKESYKAYEIEMADETLPTEEDVEINSGPPRQQNWLKKNFVRNPVTSNLLIHTNALCMLCFYFIQDQAKPSQNQKKGPDGFPVTQTIKRGSTEEARMQAVALKHRLNAQERALAQKQAEVEELKEQVGPTVKAKELMDELRETTFLCQQSNRCVVQFKPRWGSTASVRKWIRDAVEKNENQSFNDLCSEVARRGAENGKKNGWTGKITFICAIIPQD